MSTVALDRTRGMALMALSKQEIDRRIGRVIAEVFDEESGDPMRDNQPRWISAAEIVRRVSPLVSLN